MSMASPCIFNGELWGQITFCTSTIRYNANWTPISIKELCYQSETMDSSANHFRALCNRLEKSVILILKYLENLFSKKTVVSFIKTKKTIKTKLIIIIIIFLQKCLNKKLIWKAWPASTGAIPTSTRSSSSWAIRTASWRPTRQPTCSIFATWMTRSKQKQGDLKFALKFCRVCCDFGTLVSIVWPVWPDWAILEVIFLHK